jgi:two-component system, OmpR family, sensor kinase
LAQADVHPEQPDLLGALPVAVALLDAGGGALWLNPRMQAWLGAEAPAQALVPLPGRPDLVQRDQSVFRAHRRTLPDGTALVVVDPSPVEDPEFLSVAAHDLRGTLSNVRSFASLLSSRGEGLDDKARRAMDVIVRNADRALRQVRDVFDVLRHRAGAMPVSPEELDPAGALEQAAARLERDAAERGVRIERDLVLDLPHLQADPERFLHATSGFLEHALSRAPSGSTVQLRAFATGRSLYVGVTDRGPLPSGQEVRTVYAPSRVVSERRLGAGFGLCLAHDEVEAMGGATGVTLTPREGSTTFFFTLPFAPH